jgi:polyhydroxybutyrate depolymerase
MSLSSARSGIAASLLLTAWLVACAGDGGTGSGVSRATTPTDDDAGTTTDTDAGPSDPTPGCGTPVASAGYLGSQSLKVGGVTRTFALTLPAAYDGKKTYPLVLAFHGDGGDGEGLRGYFPIEDASGDGAIVAYPDGLDQTWNIDQDPQGAAMADIELVDAIIAKLSSGYCVDKKKVFLTGFSKGAYFVNQVACRTRSRIAGIVTHAGGGPFGITDSEFDANGDLVCPSPPVAAMQIQGASDGTVPPSEGQKARDYWVSANKCTGGGTTPTDPSPCVRYNGCAHPEVWCLVPNMGHTIWKQGAAATWGFFQSL